MLGGKVRWKNQVERFGGKIRYQIGLKGLFKCFKMFVKKLGSKGQVERFVERLGGKVPEKGGLERLGGKVGWKQKSSFLSQLTFSLMTRGDTVPRIIQYISDFKSFYILNFVCNWDKTFQ